jgi:hypothetical protein
MWLRGDVARDVAREMVWCAYVANLRHRNWRKRTDKSNAIQAETDVECAPR